MINEKNDQLDIYHWMNQLKLAWETKDPRLVPSLCAVNFEYYESPFEAAITTEANLVEVWLEVPKTQEKVTFNYEVVQSMKDFHIVHWNAIIQLKNSKQFENYDGIFFITLDNEGLCTEFHQWWNKKSS